MSNSQSSQSPESQPNPRPHPPQLDPAPPAPHPPASDPPAPALNPPQPVPQPDPPQPVPSPPGPDLRAPDPSPPGSDPKPPPPTPDKPVDSEKRREDMDPSDEIFRDTHRFRYDPEFRQWYPIPRWLPDSHRPWKKGESKAAWIWPRDKRLKNSPLGSSRRWKDILTGKGPGIFVGDRTKFGPTRRTWSGWTQGDNHGYIQKDGMSRKSPFCGGPMPKYDFNAREYTHGWNDRNVWSDVKWGRDGNIPMYVRNGVGEEWTYGTGYISPWGGQINPFAHNPWTPYMDWARPEPQRFWRPFLHD